MGIHYLTFMGRDLENKKKLTPVQTMNNVGMINMNIVSSGGIFGDKATMNDILTE